MFGLVDVPTLLMFGLVDVPIEKVQYISVALDCTVPPVWLVLMGVYLIYFLIGNLSYSPSSEPSRIVLFLDVMYSTDPHQRRKSFSAPWAAPFPPWIFLLCVCLIWLMFLLC